MSLAVDVMHLIVIAAGVGVGAWALVGLRRRLPKGRFVVFATASAGSLFGCAALAGEVGLLPPVAWFALVMSAMLAVATMGARMGHARASAA